MADWKANPGCEEGVSVNQSYVSGLNLSNDDKPQEMTLILPSEFISSLSAASTPGAGQSIWNGIDFAVDAPLNQILQPVLWKGSNFSIPDAAGNLPNYVWVYDADSDVFRKSSAWTSQDLDQYTSYGFAAGMVLHYYDDKTWFSISSDSPDEFNSVIEDYKDNLFINSQYVEYADAWYGNGNNAVYDQLSQDIIAVPADVDATVTLRMEVSEGGDSVTMTSRVDIPGVTEGVPESVLKVTELHNPTSREWTVSNVFNTSPLEDLWQIANGISPVVVEATVTGTGPNCAEATAEAWDGPVISIDLVPSSMIDDLGQVDSGNPITPIE